MTTPGLDAERASAYLADRQPAMAGPLRFDLVAAGGSNLTYVVSNEAGERWALRRPPAAVAVATAHDMAREWKIIAALSANSAVPVPQPVLWCDDHEVIGAPFYVMEFVDGLVLRDRSSAAALTPEQAIVASESLIATQHLFHTVDLDAVGLADLGRHDGYVQRQLKRWRGQVERDAARPCPELLDLHTKLAAAVPPERAAPGLAHGDYRFDNTILGPDHSVAAVLDWELCTTGNPIADFVWSLQYWADAGDPISFLADPPTTLDVFPNRDWVLDRYVALSGFDLSDLDYYTVFSWWKQACIVEGVYARRLRGSRGGMTGATNEDTAERATALATRAVELGVELLR